MRIAFAGTPAFARAALAALLAAGHDVALVLTQPDRPAGRGLKLKPSEVKALALERGVEVHQPSSLSVPEALEPLAATGARLMVVAAYGLILPQGVLDLFPLGCINIHASLLPRWRGAAPIQRAILAGDAETGISIMQMDAGLDTGPVYLQEAVAIGDSDTAQILHDKLAEMGAQCIVRALAGMEEGRLQAQPQPEGGVSYAHKIGKKEAELDWRRPAAALDRQVRAFNPFPVATTSLRGEALRIWRAEPVAAEGGRPGSVSRVDDRGIVVDCGLGQLRLLELQRAGGRPLPAREFLRGCPVKPGEQLGP